MALMAMALLVICMAARQTGMPRTLVPGTSVRPGSRNQRAGHSACDVTEIVWFREPRRTLVPGTGGGGLGGPFNNYSRFLSIVDDYEHLLAIIDDYQRLLAIVS